MLAIIAAILAIVGFILGGSQAHTTAWLTPNELLIAAVALIALHVAGIGNRRP